MRFQINALVCLLALFSFVGCNDKAVVSSVSHPIERSVTVDTAIDEPVAEESAEVVVPPPVRVLRLDNTEVDDAELGRISLQNPELVELTLGGTQVTDAGLVHLQNLPRLRVIRLSRTAITDDGMRYLAMCEALENIDVSQTEVGDSGIWELRTLPRLRILNLFRTRVTDAGLSAFQSEEFLSASRIERLNLDRCAITDAGLPKLASLSNLQWLHLGVTDITDAGLAELKQLESLTEVIVTRTEATAEGVERLRVERPDMTVRDNVSENVTQEAIDEATEFRRQR